MIHHPSLPRTLLAAALALAVAGCGYSSKTLYPKSYRTVAVPIFGNKTFRREWEFRLTEAIDKNIEARTPYKIAYRQDADTILSGTIVDISEDVLTRRYSVNLPRETQLTVTVDFAWRDARTGRTIVERKKFNRSATEIPQIGESVEDAEQRAIEECAYSIVSQMMKDF